MSETPMSETPNHLCHRTDTGGTNTVTDLASLTETSDDPMSGEGLQQALDISDLKTLNPQQMLESR